MSFIENKMYSWAKATWLTASTLSYVLNVNPVIAAPGQVLHGAHFHDNTSHPFEDIGLSGLNTRATNIPLRILSVGASIMSGTGSSTGDGYVICLFIPILY